MKVKNKILIIPDVHGRTFWKKAIDTIKDADQIVFLGDYLDHYDDEGIKMNESIKNFEEILKFANENREITTMLLGNHDLGYLYYHFLMFANGGRHYYERHDDCAKLFIDNRPLFKLCEFISQNNKTYLFSHAGVAKDWYEGNKKIIGDFTEENINNLTNSNRGISVLEDMSHYRRGRYNKGSIVWSDIMEHLKDEEKGVALDDVYQIFGHTQLKDTIIRNTFACIDTRHGYVLENNELKKVE